MVLEITAQGILAFGLAVGLLVMFSIMDIKTRKVSNELMAISLAMGLLAGIVTRHFLDLLLLHLTSLVIAVLLVIPLFHKGAIGGADAKTVLLLACISPGFEFGQYGNPMFEATMGVVVPLFVMFVIAILYRRKRIVPDDRPTPLIPFLLIGYLLVQMFALI